MPLAQEGGECQGPNPTAIRDGGIYCLSNYIIPELLVGVNGASFGGPGSNAALILGDNFRAIPPPRFGCRYATVCRMSFPLTMKITISATLVAWSATRSRHLAM